MATRTKKLRGWYWVFRLLSILCFVAPIVSFTLIALISDQVLIYEKFALCGSVMVVLIMSLVALLNKAALRCRLWILLIGLYICLDNIMTPLIVIAICQIVDELIFTPLYKHFGNRLTINKEIDKR